MYQVLYRKWRSRTFSEVVGQPHVTTTLRRALAAGQLSHAYLFTGPRGTGKTSCARLLAKSVNCLHPAEGEPCNECELCRGIDAGTILDVIEIDAASNNGVDNIRDLRDEANFTPSQGKYRVYIIDEVHMLSAGAFNALLKTLEEPPSYVLFILATTELHKLPATVLSRCQRFDFHRIAAEDIAARLRLVAKEEAIPLEEDAAMLLARVADGAMRDALSLLDRCRAGGEPLTAASVAKSIGMADRRYLFSLTEACLAGNISGCLEGIHELYQDACDMERLCAELTGHFRNLLVTQTVTAPQELILCTKDDLALYREQAAKADAATLLAGLDVLEAAADALRRSADRRMELELAMIKLCAAAAPAAAPLAPASAAAPPALASPARPNAEQTPAAEAPSVQPIPPAATEDLPFAAWPAVLEAILTDNAPLAGILHGSRAFQRGDIVLIQSDNPTVDQFLRQAVHASVIKEAITKVTGGKTRLGIYRSAAPAQTKDPFANLVNLAGKAEL
ncbi:MAG: DNA polymerase III subunit gamma/tau [Oscillospiraceae bacterium]|jgi:DNA polymerase-3 subunit gamma/tau|nr:DNA polymerase III subunit gamma/tau [Oscillospiraceae bacterium]